jgi:hypothetical protein
MDILKILIPLIYKKKITVKSLLLNLNSNPINIIIMTSILQVFVNLYNDIHYVEKEIEKTLFSNMRFDIYDLVPEILVTFLIWSVSMKVFRDSGYRNLMSTLHAIIVSCFCLFNIFMLSDGQEEIYQDYLFVLMLSYFIADHLINCTENRYDFFIYGLHHSLSIIAMYKMINQRNWQSASYASKCALVEMSTPFLNWWYMSKSKLVGILFLLLFFSIRIIWLTYLTIEAHDKNLPSNKFEFGVMLCFVSLNYYWFAEIVLKILRTQKNSSDSIRND